MDAVYREEYYEARPSSDHPHGLQSASKQKKETMSDWLSRQASNHNVQLAAIALVSGVTVAGAIFTTQAIRRKERVEELKASIPELSENHRADLVLRFLWSSLSECILIASVTAQRIWHSAAESGVAFLQGR